MSDDSKKKFPQDPGDHGEDCGCPDCSGDVPDEIIEDLEWVDDNLDPVVMGMIDEAFDQEMPHRVAMLANTMVLNGVGLLQQIIGEEATVKFLEEITGAVRDGEFEPPLVLDLEDEETEE